MSCSPLPYTPPGRNAIDLDSDRAETGAFVEADLSPYEALKAVTAGAARLLGAADTRERLLSMLHDLGTASVEQE